MSGPQVQTDLLHEFSLHADVSAVPVDVDGALAVSVDTNDSAAAMWDVRATVGMFDDRATEITDQG